MSSKKSQSAISYLASVACSSMLSAFLLASAPALALTPACQQAINKQIANPKGSNSSDPCERANAHLTWLKLQQQKTANAHRICGSTTDDFGARKAVDDYAKVAASACAGKTNMGGAGAQHHAPKIN